MISFLIIASFSSPSSQLNLPLHLSNVTLDLKKNSLLNRGSLILPRMQIDRNFAVRFARISKSFSPFLISYAENARISVSGCEFRQFLAPAILVDTVDITLTGSVYDSSNRNILKSALAQVLIETVELLTISDCTFSQMTATASESNNGWNNGGGLSLSFGFNSQTLTASSRVVITNCAFTDCNAESIAYGAGLYISSTNTITLSIEISGINVTGCSSYYGSAIAIIPGARASLRIDQSNFENNAIVQNSGLEMSNIWHIENCDVDVSYCSFDGTNTLLHLFYVYLLNCDGIMRNLQFSNIQMGNTGGYVIYPRATDTNHTLEINHVCFTFLNNVELAGIGVTGDNNAFMEVMLNEFYNTNHISNANGIISSIAFDTPLTDGCADITPSFVFTASNAFTQSNVFTAGITALAPDSGLTGNEIGMIVGIILAIIVVIIIITIIIICCKRQNCVCVCCVCCLNCQTNAFEFSDGEESSHQELYFPNFESRTL